MGLSVVDDVLVGSWWSGPVRRGCSCPARTGCSGGLSKRVLESALDGEITDHLGYHKHDPAGRNSGNSRNGSRSKTVPSSVITMNEKSFRIRHPPGLVLVLSCGRNRMDLTAPAKSPAPRNQAAYSRLTER